MYLVRCAVTMVKCKSMSTRLESVTTESLESNPSCSYPNAFITRPLLSKLGSSRSYSEGNFFFSFLNVPLSACR